MAQFDFRASLYYYSKGIILMGDQSIESQLYLELHEGACLAGFALGEADTVHQYAQNITERLPLEKTLKVHQIVIKSLAQTNRLEEAIAKGVDILRQLNFDPPLVPSQESIFSAVVSTDRIASQYSLEDVKTLCDQEAPSTVLNIAKIFDSFSAALYASNSPFSKSLSLWVSIVLNMSSIPTSQRCSKCH